MRRLVFFLQAVLFASCGGSNTVPSGIIPRQEMETIIWQLMQSDEYVNALLIKDSAKKSNTEKMKIYQQVFDLNATSMSQFRKSYQYYMAHPDITKIMFDSITAKATRQRNELYKPTSDTLTAKPSTTAKVDSAKTGVANPAAINLKQDAAKLKQRKGKLLLPVKPVRGRNK